jgi:hypothetical protein
VDDEIARVQVCDSNIRQSDAVVIAEAHYRIVATIGPLERGVRMAAQRILQKLRELAVSER